MNELYIFHKLLNFSTILKPDPLSWFISSFSENPTTKYQLLILCESILFLVLLFAYRSGEKEQTCQKTPLLETCLLSLLTFAFIYFLDQSLLLLLFLNPLLLILNVERLLKDCDQNSTWNLALYFFLCTLSIVIAKPFSLLLFLILLVRHISLKIGYSKFLYIPLGLLALYLNFENTPIFDYPRDVTLTPFSPLVHSGAVDIGVDNLPFTPNYSAYLKYRYSGYFALLALTLSLFIFQLKEKQFKLAQLSGLTTLICILILSSNPDTVTLFLETPLIRFIPGLAYFPLPAIFPLFASTLLLGLFKFKDKTHQYALSLSLTILVIFAPEFLNSEVYALERSHIVSGLQGGTVDQNMTPSNYLNEVYEGLTFASDDSQYKELAIPNNCVASASVHSDDALKALDGKTTTRWSTKGPQNSGDYFELTCSEELEFNKVELNLGSTPADFPRGLTIQLDDNAILTLHDWLGPIKKSNQGLLYFGAQHEVEFTFAQKQKFKKIRFSIEGGDNTFDWAISEMKFYRSLLD